jgi:hypothetical protein
VGFATIFAFLALVVGFFTYVVLPIYYYVAPARSFVDYYSAKVADTPVGTEPQMTLCRTINYDAVQIKAVRTFIKYEDGDKAGEVLEYNFDAAVTKNDSLGDCTTVRLNKQPQYAGTYSVHTTIEFYVHQFRKTYSYDTNRYKMFGTTKNTQSQIDELKKQLEKLQALRAEEEKDESPNIVYVQPQENGTEDKGSQKAQTATPDKIPDKGKGNTDKGNENSSRVLTFLNRLLSRLSL